MTQPPDIPLPAFQAATCAAFELVPNTGQDWDATAAQALAGLTAAWPHLLQAIINDAYDNHRAHDLAAGYAGDWLAHRYATILAALEES